MSDEARLARAIASWERSRLAFPLLALAIGGALFFAFERNARRLDALAASGVQTTAVVGTVEERWVEFAYEVDGAGYTSSTARDKAPSAPGAPFEVRYLPADPSMVRAGGAEDARAEARDVRRSTPKFLAVVLGFFLSLAVQAELRLRRLRRLGVVELGMSPEVVRARMRIGMATFLGPAVLAVSAWHASDAVARGESVWPVILGAAIPLGVLAGVTHAITSAGGRAGARLQTILTVCGTISFVVALLRTLVWLGR